MNTVFNSDISNICVCLLHNAKQHVHTVGLLIDFTLTVCVAQNFLASDYSIFQMILMAEVWIYVMSYF